MKKYGYFLSAILLACDFLLAQPNLFKEANITLLDNNSLYYNFTTLNMKAQKSGQIYKIYLAVPKKSSDYYNVVYMLDGNAVLDVLDENLLSKAGEANLLIVMIGYETKARFDTVARAYDYTPPISNNSMEDVPGSGRKAGGAELFLEFIEKELKPEIAKTTKADLKNQTLWGHSYGGLFVLYTLFTQPNSFQKYASISPSLWWHNGYILNKEKEFNALTLKYPANLIVMAGEDEKKQTNMQHSQRAKMQNSISRSAIKDMVLRLDKKANLSAKQIEFENLSHGETIKASLEPLFGIVR
ncbi:MAG: hypothetical protein LBS39_03945 [Campylobacteraceae bacterium]|jgi:predicted alpha/beta superfamily hydrolase|nr:hypothetical protein [Campylobacteraceae bacterium]